jgi:hypothetical protein
VDGELEPLLKGAENAVRFLGIRPDSEVLLGYATTSDRSAVEAVATCIRRLGARLSTLIIDPPALNEPFPRVVYQAAQGVDYFLTMGAGPGLHSLDHYRLLYDHGVSVCSIKPVPGFLASEEAHYPFGLWFEIHNRLKWQISRHEVDPGVNVTFRVTDELGSDLSWKVKCPENLGAFIGEEPLSAGWWGAAPRPRILTRAGFPPSILSMGDLQYSGTGVLYVDSTNYFGRTPEPWRLTFENGYCTKIDGGREGRIAWEMTVGRYLNGNRLRECGINVHPKAADRVPDFDPDARVPLAAVPAQTFGDFLIALGGDTGVGGVDPGYEHTTTLFAVRGRTTISVDGEPIVEGGRLLLLDDPDLRRVAADYGDPDYLLSPVG